MVALTLPTPGASSGTWGSELNALLATLDARTSDARVVNFAQQPNVDRTGATACDAALATVLATASTASPIEVFFPPGTYKFNDPWGHVDQRAVSFRGTMGGTVTLDFTALTAGEVAVEPYAAASSYAVRPFMQNLHLLGGSVGTCFKFGGAAAKWSPFMRFEAVDIQGFDLQVVYGENTWLHAWKECQFHDSTSKVIDSPFEPNSGENLHFYGCALYNNNGEVLFQRNPTAGFFFHNCSFDYNGRDFNVNTGLVVCHGGWLEGNDTRKVTGADEAVLITTPGAGLRSPTVMFDGMAFVPRWPTRTKIINIGGDGSAAVHLRSVNVFGDAGQVTYKPNVVVADTSTAVSTVIVDGVYATGGSIVFPANAQTRVGTVNQYAVDPFYTMASPAGHNRDIRFNTAPSSGVSTGRWYLRVTSDAESGGNAGSKFQLICRDDAGNPRFTILDIARPNGVAVWGRSIQLARATQTLASAGAVTVDAGAANRHEVTLQANATSTTIASGAAGMSVTLMFIQDATGGRTYAWPASCRFAGGVAPSDTTANRRTSVTFVHDGTAWNEISRAVAVG